MGLVDDALIQYEELEASFFQTMKGEHPQTPPHALLNPNLQMAT